MDYAPPKPSNELPAGVHGRAPSCSPQPSGDRLPSLTAVLCHLCATCGPLAAAMLTLGLLFAVLSCPAWTLGVWLPHPVLGAVVAAEGMHRLRRIHTCQHHNRLLGWEAA